MIGKTLQKIGAEFPAARSSPFGGSPIADFLRHQAPAALQGAVGDQLTGLILDSSPGAGQWAEVPWIAVLDPLITESATQGYYIVYLFRADGKHVYLSLNQGATEVQEEFKSRANDILRDRANIIRARLADFSSELNISEIDLQATTRLAKAYEAGHALGKNYNLANLPNEETLQKDLVIAIKAYRALSFRGGLTLEPDPETQETNKKTTVLEKRQMVFHEKIERRYVSQKVKKHLGTRCQACNLDMSELYGEIGSGFIEAHHLIPLSTLQEGEIREYDIAKDFAVLCPNCHRMIHRYPNRQAPTPNDLEGFRKVIKATQKS